METRSLATIEIGAVTAASTADLRLKNQTKPIGEREGRIIVPNKELWRDIAA